MVLKLIENGKKCPNCKTPMTVNNEHEKYYCDKECCEWSADESDLVPIGHVVYQCPDCFNKYWDDGIQDN